MNILPENYQKFYREVGIIYTVIAILLFASFTITPLLSIFLGLPMIIIFYRYPKEGWLVYFLVLSSSYLLWGLAAIIIILVNSSIAIVMAFSYRKEKNSFSAIMLGGITGTFIFIWLFAISVFYWQADWLSMFTSAFSESIGTMKTMLPTNIGTAIEVNDFVQYVLHLLPAFFIIISFIISFINNKLFYFVIVKYYKDNRIYYMKRLKYWIFPKSIIYLYFLDIFYIYNVNYHHLNTFDYLYTVAINVQVLIDFLLILEGLALTAYIMDRFKWKKVWQYILLIFLFSNPVLQSILILFGLLDLYFDLRMLNY